MLGLTFYSQGLEFLQRGVGGEDVEEGDHLERGDRRDTWDLLGLHSIAVYYTTCETSSANIGRYYTGKQLTAQLRQRAVKRQLNVTE